MVNIQIDLALIIELIQHSMNNLRIKMDVLILVQRLQMLPSLCVTGDVKINPRQVTGLKTLSALTPVHLSGDMQFRAAFSQRSGISNSPR